MNTTDTRGAGLLAGLQAGHRQARTDRKLAADASHAGATALLPLAAIQDRALNTREVTDEHLEALAESIAALGLLEPLVVDRDNRLLAGAHRLAALKRLAAADPERWGNVHVRRMEFAADADPARALAVEVAENEQRRDYAPAEVRALADRLQAAGFRATPGRPRKGTKALLPALGAVVNKSKRQLLRILNPADAGETVPRVTFFQAADRLRRALAAFAEAGTRQKSPAARRALADAEKLTRALEALAHDNT